MPTTGKTTVVTVATVVGQVIHNSETRERFEPSRLSSCVVGEVFRAVRVLALPPAAAVLHVEQVWQPNVQTHSSLTHGSQKRCRKKVGETFRVLGKVSYHFLTRVKKYSDRTKILQ